MYLGGGDERECMLPSHLAVQRGPRWTKRRDAATTKIKLQNHHSAMFKCTKRIIHPLQPSCNAQDAAIYWQVDQMGHTSQQTVNDQSDTFTTRVAFGLPLGGYMQIPATVVFADIFLSFTRAKASKLTIMTEPCLLTCLALSIAYLSA